MYAAGPFSRSLPVALGGGCRHHDRTMTLVYPAGPDASYRPHMEYEFDDDKHRLDLDVIWQFLSTDAYWGRWRTRQDVELQVAGAWRVVGCYQQRRGEMVGFARALSDGVALAYLADVFIAGGHRGMGLGQGLVKAMIEDGPGSDFRWLLHTRDAHRLYEKFAFGPPDHTLMERRHITSRPHTASEP